MNNENLIPFNQRTESEQREIRSKGGKASGISRSFRSATKKRLKEHPELFEDIITMLTDKALGGDLKALEMLIELSGESPKQAEIAIKKKELKLKEQALKRTEPEFSTEEPMLYKALGAEEE